MNKMKWIVLCATAVFAASCSDRLEDEIAQITGKPVTLCATIEDAGTRAAIDGGKVNWQEGDAISVRLSDKTNLTMKIKSGAGTTSATFTGVIEGDGKLTTPTVAVYPAGAHDLTGAAAKVNMPATYTVADNDNTNMPMLCEFAADGTGTFKHLGGVMRFRIGMDYVPAGAAKVRFTTLDKQNITGSFTVADGEIAATEGDGTASSVTITFNADQIDATEKELIVNVPLPVGTYKGFDLDILDAAGNKLAETLNYPDATNTVARAKRIVMTKLTPVELNAGTGGSDPLPANAIAVDNTPTSFNANND